MTAVPPQSFDGTWLELNHEAGTAVTRSIVARPDQKDATFAIRRVDPVRLDDYRTPEYWAQATTSMMSWTRAMSEHLLDTMVRKLERGPNAGLFYRQMVYGHQGRQTYCDGAFRLEPDQALILQAKVPEKVRYWSVQLMDPLYGSIDIVSHQSSINGVQAHVDDDGIARIVVSATDPGIANWLDTAGWREGAIMWRWNDVDHQPAVTVRLVRLGELAACLPASTKLVSRDERQARLQDRAEHFQLRGS